MKKIFGSVSVFFVMLLFNSCYHPSSAESFENLKGLEGNWTSYKGIKFNEKWVIVNDSLMQGLGFTLNGTDTVFSEKLLIERRGDSVYYGAYIENNGHFVYFVLDDADKTSWSFRNAEHDYPNIIEYEFENDTTLEVFTSNLQGNKKISFSLKRSSF